MNLLLDVSGRLHDARDFVRFHAVCRRWRNAAPAAARHKFFPWMLSQHPGRGVLMHIPVFYLGSVAPEAISTYHCCYDGNVLPSLDDTAWVAGPNGEAVWRFDWHPKPTLHDIVTGAICPLPHFPADNYEIVRRLGNPLGIVYGDGTVFLYSFDELNIHMTGFTAAVLRPGDTTWVIMEKRFYGSATYKNNCAAYHNGKVFVWTRRHFYCFMTQNLANNGGDIDGIRLEMTEDRPEHKRYMRYYNYVFESCGKLLWASVLLEHEWYHKNMDTLSTNDPVIPMLAVMVHEAEEEVDSGKIKMRWVERDGRSLGDHVMFLGSPTSFAVDSTQLDMDGGCAYFVFLHRLYRYNFITGETKLVESPRTGWISPDAHLWLRPRPVISPIDEIRESLRIRPNRKEDQRGKKSAIQWIYKWFSGIS
ncbi:hypothetical protein CFC21_073309 [Triticum aestivum]|uniref:KIB1-4 beta-propeller domain-containing protein n=2 Tax=Triticum aestivum TaxID=4565 RepID=A0A3B6LSQ0_WHEAT|nr:hypothetical protein CFC21_073309 [Triticum aestivum]